MQRAIAFSIATSICLSLLFVSALAAAEPEAKTPTKAELEKRFADSMSGVTMIGYYTHGSPEKGKDLPEDRYSITKVTKVKDDIWIFNARIETEGHDLTLPIPLKVLWAGDTPVITLDETSIPGLGTFGARVLIHNHNYAGTWSHGDEGGQMFGRIEKAAANEGEKSRK